MKPWPQDGRAGADLLGRPWIQRTALAAVIALCNANTLAVPFLLDDPPPDQPLDLARRWLVALSFALNRWISGADPWSYHVFNALVHLGCAVLLCAAVSRAAAYAVPGLGDRVRERLAFATALLWACHPVQTAAVTYISQRAETLATLFYLAFFLAFLRAAEVPRPRPYQVLAVLALVLALSAKEIAATAPVIAWVFDAAFLARSPRRTLQLRPGFHAVLVATTLACALTFAAPSLLSEGSSAGFGLADFTALDYALTQPGVLLHYLRLVVWPVGLCFDPGWPIARAVGEWLPQSLVVGALLATSIALLLRRSWMGFAGVGFFLVLAPSSSIVPILDPAFEHRLYLALLFPLLFLVAAVPGLCVRPRPDARWLPTLLVGAAVLLSTALTLRRNHDYRSAFELWRLTAQQAPHNKRAHLNLGAMLLDANRVEEAIEALLKSLALDPLNADANLNLGNAFMRKGESKRALPFLMRAEEALGDVACADALGRALLLEGDPARAAEYLERAVAGSPDEARLHRLLATAYEGAGALERALEEYRRALVLEPDHAQARARVRELEGHGQDPRNGPRARPDKPGASRDPERP